MSMTRLLAVARKEVVQILRDSRSLIIVVIMPVMLVLLFGYGVNLDLKGLPVYVYDRDGSQQSQDLLKRFQASEYFHIVRVVDNYSDVTQALDDGHAKMGIVIPWDFSQRLRDGQPVQVQALVDGTDDNTANVAHWICAGGGAGLLVGCPAGLASPAAGRFQPAALSVETRTWYNEDLESSAFIIPGVLALVMSVIGAFLTSLTIAREWERGTMEQLISTPVSRDGDHAGQAGAILCDWNVRCDRMRADCDLLVRCAISRVVFHAAGQFRPVYGGGAFAGVFYFGGGEEPVCRESDCAADYLSSGISTVGISLCDRTDARGLAMDHARSSCALLRFYA